MYSSRVGISPEWETTISINSNECDFLTVLANKNHEIDLIFLLKDGLRLANRMVQKKVIVSSRKLLTYYKGNWIPLERTTATEENVFPPTTIIVEKCIHRVIVYKKNGIRVSYNKEISTHGEKYNIEYEVEYPANTEYKLILREERRLMKLFIKHGNFVQRDIMTRIDMFSCVMSKVQMWHCFDSKSYYIWAFKWNGVKAKMLITDKLQEDGSLITYIWSDASNIRNKMSIGTNIKHLINICCAVEIMEDRIVIIEAIGTMVNKTIYTTEPIANASFLKHLDKLLTNDAYVGKKPLIVQKFYPPPLPKNYGPEHDGFIIIQNDLIIKWKIPTVDVKCVEPYKFKVGSTIITLAFAGEPRKVYEMTLNNEILRQRNDRLTSSSDQEYAVFLESSKMLQTE